MASTVHPPPPQPPPTRQTRRRRVRRNRITRADARIVVGISAAAALAAAFAGMQPTAWRPADIVLSAALAGLVAWAGASAPWWLLAMASGVATLTATTSLVATLAAGAAFVFVLVLGARAWNWPLARAAAAAVTINVLFQLDLGGFHGSSALVTGVIAFAVVLGGLARRGRYARLQVRRALLAVGALVALAVVGAVIGILQAAGAVRDGERELRDAARALRRGDVEVAAEALAASRDHLDSAATALGRPWARPALAVPVLGQHLDTVSTIADEATELAEAASTSVSQINVDSLRVREGVIDLTAIELLQTPFVATEDALREMSGVLAVAGNPWLLWPVDETVDELAVEVDDLVEQTATGRAAAQLAPSMLGADGRRTYFVAFTTPAESRGLGGFMGTWAEIRADGGTLDVVRTGQTGELIQRYTPTVLQGPDDYLSRYGRFGAGGDGEPASVDFWLNYTISPDLPSVAEVARQLYPRSGGRELDGVIAVDVFGIARFLDLTGSIKVPEVKGRITANNAVEYLLRQQYAEIADDDLRDDVLERITDQLLDQIFNETLPGPRVLARTLGPSLAEGHVAVWSFDGDDQELLDELGVTGAMPAPEPDGLVVTSTNAGANKLDAYLRRSITYEGVYDRSSGRLRTQATIRLTNAAPETGLPADVSSNRTGLPRGTNRMYVSVYSPWVWTAARRDGEPTRLEPNRELGWWVYSTYVDIPPGGGEVVLELEFRGELPAGTRYGFALRSPPLALPDVVRLDIRERSGETLLASHEPRVGTQIFLAD